MEALTFSREGLREVDRRAVEEYGIPILVLMENAGVGVFRSGVIASDWGGLRGFKVGQMGGGRGVLVVAGGGQNGGDALVAARHLSNSGMKVTVILMAAREKYREASGVQLKIVEAMKLPIETMSEDHAELRDWVVESAPGDVIIDGIFGTGLSRPVEGLAAEVIRAMNGSKRPIVSVDIPSGLDTDSGEELGVAVRATETVSFCGLKRGFAKARTYTGKVTVADIGVPRELLVELADK